MAIPENESNRAMAEVESVQWIVPASKTGFGSPDDQVWTESDGRFGRVTVGGETFDVGSRESEILGSRYCPRCGKTLGLPPSFDFCPNCGSSTAWHRAENGLHRMCNWPSYLGNGWAEASSAGVSSLVEPVEHSISGGDWGIVAAAEPALLLAYDHAYGQILRLEPDGSWAALARAPSSGLEPWQRSLHASAFGLFIPTERGLTFLPSPFVRGTRLLAATTVLGNAQPCGGIGLLGSSVYLPVIASGELLLHACSLTRSPSRDPSTWQSMAVKGNIRSGQRLGTAYTNEASDVFWSSEDGYLALSTDDDGIEAQFLEWRKGFRALPAARPYRSRRGGGAWQLGRYSTEASAEPVFAFHLVSRSATRQEVRQVDGPHLSYGPGTFRGDKRYEEPWGEESVDYDPASDDKVLVPVAVFGQGEEAHYLVAILSGRRKLWELVSQNGMEKSSDARLFLLGRRQGNIVDLGMAATIDAPHDISSTILGDRIFLYARCENRIVSWRMLS